MLTFSLNKLYQSIGLTKQAFHQRMDRYLQERSLEEQLWILKRLYSIQMVAGNTTIRNF